MSSALGWIEKVDMKILGALLVLMYATCPVAGFAAEDVTKVSYKNMIRLNSLNVTKITTGMTKDEVVQIMGNIQVNSILISETLDGVNENIYPWLGTYFKNIPFQLIAVILYNFFCQLGTLVNRSRQIAISGNKDTYNNSILITRYVAITITSQIIGD